MAPALLNLYCPLSCTQIPKKSSNTTFPHLSDFLLLAKSQKSSSYFKIANELVCLQMMIREPIDIPNYRYHYINWKKVTEDLLRLVKIVYPAYFKSKTATLGNYYGIYKDNQLLPVSECK
jgi:hypothetical protein